MPNIPVKIQYRSSLWFGCYQHSLKIHITEAGALRLSSPAAISNYLSVRREWGRRHGGLFLSNPGSWVGRYRTEITAEHEADLCALLDYLSNDPREYRKTIEGDWIYFYTQDLGLLDDLQALPFLDQSHMERSEVVLQGTPDCIALKNPQHQYRTYFRANRVSQEQNSMMCQFLISQSDIRISPALKSHIEHNQRYWRDHYFIDHDSTGINTMLEMICPGVTRKTMCIEKAK